MECKNKENSNTDKKNSNTTVDEELIKRIAKQYEKHGKDFVVDKEVLEKLIVDKDRDSKDTLPARK